MRGRQSLRAILIGLAVVAVLTFPAVFAAGPPGILVLRQTPIPPVPPPPSPVSPTPLPPGNIPPGLPPGNSLPGDGSSAEPVDPPVPAVALRIRVPAEAEPGQELTYRFIVANLSKAPAHHVVVRNSLPAGARFVRADPPPATTTPTLTWPLGTLLPCGRKEITLVIVPGEGTDLQSCARVQFEHGECVRTRLLKGGTTRPDPFRMEPGRPEPGRPEPPPLAGAIRLRKFGPEQAVLNDIKEFRLEVTNAGRTRLRNVVLTDTLPESVEPLNTRPATAEVNPLVWKVGDLEPGQTRQFRYDAVIKKAGTLTSQAVVEADGDLRQQTTHTIRVDSPGLAVLVTGPRARLVGRPTTYQITVNNPGTTAVTNVHLLDELVKEVAFLGASDGGRSEREQVRWNLGTIAAGGQRRVQVTVKSNYRGRFENVVTVTADRGLVEQSKIETRFLTSESLEIEVEKNPDPLNVGQEGTITIRLLNQSKAAETQVTASVVIPDELMIVDVKGGTLAGMTAKLGPIGNVPPGGEASMVLRIRGQKPGEAPLEVEASSTRLAPDKPIRSTETIRINAGSAAIKPKSAGP